MLFHYLVKYCQPPQSNWEKLTFLYRYPRSIYTGKKLIRMEDIDKDLIERIAAETDGFSGREIMKMVVAWHDAAFTTPELVLTPEIMEKVLEKFKLQHQLKATWTKDEALIFGKMDIKTDTVGSDKQTAADTVDRSKEAEELLEKISGQRLELKKIRGGQKSTQDAGAQTSE